MIVDDRIHVRAGGFLRVSGMLVSQTARNPRFSTGSE